MKLGLNHPMGPLQLADFIGLDVCLAILNVLYEGFGDPKYRACPLLRRMVVAGHLGKKVGPRVLLVLTLFPRSPCGIFPYSYIDSYFIDTGRRGRKVRLY